MQMRPIKTKADHSEALKEIERLFDAKPGTAAGDRLEILVTLWSITSPSRSRSQRPIRSTRWSTTWKAASCRAGTSNLTWAAVLVSPRC
jgi:hypothetical protein